MRSSRPVLAAAAAVALVGGVLVTVPVTASAAPPATGPGSVDSSFSGGAVTLPVPTGAAGLRSLNRMYVQPDGKVLVGGLTTDSHKTVVYRLNTDGSLDTSFGGAGDIIVSNAIASGEASSAITEDGSGNVYVGGGDTNAAGASVLFLSRFSPSGSPDTSFGTNGTVKVDLTGSFGSGHVNDHITDLTVQPDGKILASAWVGQGGGADFVLLRFTTTGALDTSFGAGLGYASTDFNGGDDTARSLALQPDGNIVVAGFAKASGGGQDDVGLVRYTPKGALDPTFGTGGKVETDFGNGGNDGAWGVTLDSTGAITVAGVDYAVSPIKAIVARYTTAGALESSFDGSGTAGRILADYGENGGAAAFSVAVDPAGRIVVAGPSTSTTPAGSTTEPGVDRFVDAAYPYDTTWNSSGRETLACTTANGGGAAVGTTSTGQVLVEEGCGTALQVSRLVGGNDVPVASSVTAGSTGNFQYTVSNVTVNGGGNTASVARGATFSVSLSYSATQSSSYCPACIDQIQLGFPNDYPSQCAFNGQGVSSGTYTGTFVAPSKPGTYYLASGPNQQYSCTTTWAQQPPPSQFIAKIVVGGVTSVAVTSDVASAPSGHLATPTGAIPATGLQAAAGSLQAAPLRSSPLRSSPLRSSPLRSSPLRSSPLRSSPLRSSPVGIALSDVPLIAPKNWADVLSAAPAGTFPPNPYANQPLQNVTLQNVFSLPAGEYPAVDALSMSDVDWSASPARNLSLAAWLLGDTPLSGLPAPGTGWCGYLAGKPLNCAADTTFPTSHSLAALQLGGDNVDDYLTSTPITLNGIPLVNSALSNIVISDLQLDQTPYGGVAAGSYASCSGCTFAQAQQNGTLSGVATLGSLLADSHFGTSTVSVTLGSLLPGLLPSNELPYNQLAVPTVEAASPYPSTGLVTYTATVGLDCVSADTLQVSLNLPPDFRYVPNTASLSVGGTSVSNLQVSGAPALTTLDGPPANRTTFSAPVSCTGTTTAVLTAKAEPGVRLGGPYTVDAIASFDSTSLSAYGQAPVTVTDNPPPAAASSDTIYLGHISRAGDVDTYSLDPTANNIQPGSQISVTLSHIPTGQDFDLVLYGPAGPTLRSSPLRSSPLRSSPLRSSGETDNSADPAAANTSAQPDPQADVPVNPPAGQVFRAESVNRGTQDDSLTTTVGDGESGGYTVQVSGYNGSWSLQPYMLQVTVVPPAGALPCAALNKPYAGQGTVGSLPGTPLPTGTQTLFLVNQQRLGDFYGASAASSVMSSLASLASRSDVQGVVVPVEGDSSVAAAYASWDANACSPSAADGVVSAINNLVDRLRNGLTQLRNVVVVGDDQIVPFARVADHTVVSNERDYGTAAAFNGTDNAESRALADGYLLSDDPYGSFNPIPWLESSLYVPNVALGRLVETPTDITNAINAYISANGVRTPSAGFTTGYDFMTGASNLINSSLATNLAALGSTATPTSQINSTWTRSDAITGITSAAGGFLALNAHYDNYRALPAGEFTNGTQNELLTTADLPASMAGGIMFTIGCHSGLSLADTFVASPTASQSAKLTDWAQAVSNKGGQLVGNTGFGYGDTDSVAYSAALMARFAQNLNGSMTVGQALLYAKQGYLHLPMGVYDAKALEEATFYGLPMYRLGASGQVAAPALPAAPPTSTTVTTVAGPANTLAVGSAGSSADPSFVAQTGSNGTYYVVHHGASNSNDNPLVVQNEPIEPQTTVAFAPRSDGLTAHGVSLDSLSTYTTTSTPTFNPVFDKPTVDLSQYSPEPQIADAFFPATLDGLVSGQTPTGARDTVVLNPGEFRSTGNNAGYQVLASSMGYHVNYSNGANFTPPTIGATSGTITAGHVAFTVSVSSPDPGGVTGVNVLYLAQASTAPQQWSSVDLAPAGNGTWSVYVPYSGSSTTIGQYIVQATDASGNVAESANKGQDFSATQAPTPSVGAPTITPTGSATSGIYTTVPTVTLSGGTGALSYSVDNGPFQPYSAPFTVSGDGTHTVTAQDAVGDAATTVLVVSTHAPTVTITSPANGASYVYSQVPAATFACTSPVGISSCVATPTSPATGLGSQTFQVTGTDTLNRPITTVATYTVLPQYAFTGFYAPLPNLGASSTVYNTAKGGSSIPLKWNLYDNANNGAMVTSPSVVTGVSQSSPFACPSQASTDPVDYTVSATTAGVVKWDSTAQQFVYVWNTSKAWSGFCMKLTFTFADTTTASAFFKFS